MKRIVTFVALFTMLWTPLPVLAQNSLLPTLQVLRTEYPQDWSHAQRGEYLNRVAWIHRIEGWGLLFKPGGNNCPTPQNVLVSCDYLVYKPTMQGYDVLADETTPQWHVGDSFLTQPGRWIPPVAIELPDPGIPEPTPGTPTEPSELLQRVTIIEQVVAEIRQQNHLHEIAEAEERAQAAQFRDDVRSVWRDRFVFIGKYIAPVLSGILAGWKLN